jgi:hypothetical protein
MATYRGVAAVSRGILKLLEDACPRAEFPNAQFELHQALDFQKGALGEGVSLFLYRIGINGTRRTVRGRVEPDGRRFRPPLPLDLCYAVCVWGRSPDVQQRLLGFCMRALEDTPILPPGLLNQQGPEPTTFRAHESVEIVGDPLNLQDLNVLWTLLKPNVPLAATYVARFVPIESEIAVIEGPEVQTRVFDLVGGPA